MNNINGGDDIHHSIYTFWNIGRLVWNKRNKYINPIEKFSMLCSYFYGNSILFNREDIRLMRRFYLDFPIFYKTMNKITWNQYKEILILNDKKERYFYYYLSIFFDSDFNDTKEFILNDYYSRI